MAVYSSSQSFQQIYRERLKESLKWLHFVKFETSLTLTVDPKRFALLFHEYVFVGKGWRKLHNWLVHKYGKFFYILVLEVTKKGRPHLHILTTLPYMDIVAVREKWVKYGGGQQMRIDNLHENFNAVGYVLKYVTKTITKSVEDTNVYSALLFASNKRLFSMNDMRNRSMLDFHHRASANSERRYEIEGSIPLGVVEALCREIGIEIEDFILIEPNNVVLLLFPDVFGTCHDDG